LKAISQMIRWAVSPQARTLLAESAKRTRMIPTIEALRVRDLTMEKEFSHCEGTASTWTFAKDYLPVQFEATHRAVGVNRDLPNWFRRFRDNHAQVVVTLWAGAVEVFGHG